LLAHHEMTHATGFGDGLDAARAAAALVTVRQMLGLPQ